MSSPSSGAGSGPAQTESAAASGGSRLQPSDGSRIVFDDLGIRRALTRIAHEILERNEEPERLYLVAIPNGGVPLARQLATNLKQIADLDVLVGVLDTTLYRDDLATTSERPMLRETVMPSDVDDRVVVLVDDVVKTGRTIRAAMDALMDFGRPKSVQLVGLVDRGHRELPIKIDFVGKNLPTSHGELIRMRSADAPGRAPEDGDVLEGPLEIIVIPEPSDRAAGAAGGGT